MPRYQVVFAVDARMQIAQAAAWWEEHRPKAPGALDEAISALVDLLEDRPTVGSYHARTSEWRLYLRRVRYDVFYVIDEDQGVVTVTALWHRSRQPGSRR